MNKIALAVVALSSLAAFGETTNQEELVKFGSKMVTREYRRNAIRMALLARTGGHVRKEYVPVDIGKDQVIAALLQDSGISATYDHLVAYVVAACISFRRAYAYRIYVHRMYRYA